VDDELLATLRIREVVQNWVLHRDAGDWERFALAIPTIFRRAAALLQDADSTRKREVIR